LPTGQSRDALAKVPAGVKVVDIGGDHRLHHEDVTGWTFGLADLLADKIRASTRVANPGCYPSAAILALAPLAQAGLLSDGPIIVDAKSGVSGAGRGGGDQLGYAEVNENVYGYKPLQHGHEPEIAAALKQMGAQTQRLAFVPHLIPMTRGILATCYATSDATANDCIQAARALYSGSPFVRVTSEPPKTKHVQGSNAALLHFAADPKRGLVVAMAAIDNLGKGAAGQAIQNANLMLGLDPAAGLTALPLWP
ncbi:MAG: N-acetyl-gamma-glutamyl-phosphate reductase, partial [Planctomycetota bacterium]